MDKKLVRSLGHKGTLKTLKIHCQKNMTVPSNSDHNIFYLLIQHDRTIGYKTGRQVVIHEGGWCKIASIVMSVTGFDLLSDDSEDMSHQGCIENAATMNNEKDLSVPPALGFLQCRLIGSPYEVADATLNFAIDATCNNSYLGVHIDTIKNWKMDALIIVENFAAFTAMDGSFVDSITTAYSFNSVLVVYKGYTKQGIYSVMAELAALPCEKYVFTDYNLSGLSLAEIIASKIDAAGYILPKQPEDNPALARLSKKAEYTKQAHVIVHDMALRPYNNDVHNRFLAVTQEAIMAHNIPVTTVRRGIAAYAS